MEVGGAGGEGVSRSLRPFLGLGRFLQIEFDCSAVFDRHFVALSGSRVEVMPKWQLDVDDD